MARPVTSIVGTLMLGIAISLDPTSPLHGADRTPSHPQQTPSAMSPDTAGRHSLQDWAHGAQLFPNMGDFHREVSSSSPQARAYFDQGMRFLWAFNHDEAARSFARAAELDRKCASCYWGVALTLGPNYNMPMMAQARAAVAWDALTEAKRLAPSATPVEQALIAALSERYRGPLPLDPSTIAPVLASYASAMRGVARRFPHDLDVQTLFAEALMNTSPWKLWNADGSSPAVTGEIVTTLEAVMARDPMHPGANHYYIHAVEASLHPERAMPSAHRVAAMMPAAGHLVHMPAHIMLRVGRYEDAAEANRRAAVADSVYYSRTAAIDYYPVSYSAHNYQFLASAAAMEGRSGEALAATRDARAIVTDKKLAGMPGSDWLIAFHYEALLRFGKWEAMLREPAPDSAMKGLFVGYLAARATALAAKGRLHEARVAAAALDAAITSTSQDAAAGMNAALPLYEIARLRANARLAAAEGHRKGAIALLRQAVSKEDQLSYDEPADEFFPTRHLLGAALLDGGMAKQAEAVYREDLRRNLVNGWSLLGLAKSLEAQGHAKAAKLVRVQFRAAWKHSDAPINASAF
jgi:tetratricopeptide (TPR) repeat protein